MEKLTLLVFKDGLASKTFQIPLRWISWLFMTLSVILTLAAVSVFFVTKYALLAARTDPSHLQELEQQLVDLKAHLSKSESKTVPQPEYSVPVSVPDSVTPTESQSTVSDTLFKAFPSGIKGSVPAPETLKFGIENLRTRWNQNTLTVSFALQIRNTTNPTQNSESEEAPQHGRILILARGPDLFMVYPPQALNPAGTETLLTPLRGEPFSVSRFREAKANFGPVPSPASLQEIEIYIFTREGDQLLSYQKLKSPHRARTAPAAPKESE
jgi:hypothetical protein